MDNIWFAKLCKTYTGVKPIGLNLTLFVRKHKQKLLYDVICINSWYWLKHNATVVKNYKRYCVMIEIFVFFYYEQNNHTIFVLILSLLLWQIHKLIQHPVVIYKNLSK